MCASCGCGNPNDKHGDNRNITMNDLDQAAQAAGTTREQVVRNMAQTAQQGGQGQQGQQGGFGRERETGSSFLSQETPQEREQ